MSLIPSLRQNSPKGLFILLVVSLAHSAGNTFAIANLPNIFSGLLWLLIGFYLVWATWRLIGSVLITHFSHNLAANFRLFK